MADAGVHAATAQDVPEITRIHRDTWRVAYAELLPREVLDGIDAQDAWRDAVEHATVLVATEGDWTVGYCVIGLAPAEETAKADGSLPADAGTTVLVTVLVEPRWGRRGHAGRLLATAAEAAREQGATRGIAWIPEADKASKGFYERVGWMADGTVRTLDAGGRPLREIRVSGDLSLQLAE
ncbi:GNAT family N-acetyltransferase [Lentzea tibetensis]|uniref:GNAT family N-acetyltransferase n=1 Tax=Lentzea tibetensis TaxID=2591470 RepID=A0A563ERN7_9PSEU|nr:GNAT family N-acetyltransferase [Lentzea tibetensis]TWP50191.1 GNAT family N-acetyltransferase [Lentzea tibetensis]